MEGDLVLKADRVGSARERSAGEFRSCARCGITIWKRRHNEVCSDCAPAWKRMR